MSFWPLCVYGAKGCCSCGDDGFMSLNIVMEMPVHGLYNSAPTAPSSVGSFDGHLRIVTMCETRNQMYDGGGEEI